MGNSRLQRLSVRCLVRALNPKFCVQIEREDFWAEFLFKRDARAGEPIQLRVSLGVSRLHNLDLRKIS
jgi:hypothetical protein